MPQLRRLDRKISKKKRGVSIVSDLTIRVSTGLDSGNPFWRTKYTMAPSTRPKSEIARINFSNVWVISLKKSVSFSSRGSEARLSDIQEMYIDKGPSFDKSYENLLARDKKPLPFTLGRDL